MKNNIIELCRREEQCHRTKKGGGVGSSLLRLVSCWAVILAATLVTVYWFDLGDFVQEGDGSRWNSPGSGNLGNRLAALRCV